MSTNDWNHEPDKKNNPNTSDLGEQIQDLVQDAINAVDFSGLSDKIKEMLGDSIEKARETGEDWKKKQEEARQNWYRQQPYSGQTPVQPRYGYGNVPPIKRPREVMPVFKKVPGKWSGPALTTFGVVGAGMSLGLLIKAGIPIVSGTLSLLSILLAGCVFGFGMMVGKGIFMRRKALRYLKYQNIWYGKTHISLEDLQEKVGLPMKQVKKDVHAIIDQHLLPVAYLDEQETYLILNREVYEQYRMAEEGRKERERLAVEAENATPEEKTRKSILEDEKKFLNELNDRRHSIDSPEMREKVEYLTSLVEKLYTCVKERPETYAQIYRVKDYYIPTVLKLLKTYDEIENQPIQGENIVKTKKEIEDSLDMINQAMEVMFDELFRDIAMDTSADISVLETMLSREGWKEQDLKATGKAPDILKF